MRGNLILTRWIVLALLTTGFQSAVGAAADPLPPASMPASVAAWLFPTESAAQSNTQSDPTTVLHLEGSAASFTREQLDNLFSAPDWHPQSHAPMPPVVLHGRRPSVVACGYCHLPTGQGRPENAALAGLPAAYLIQQLRDFQSGARRRASPTPYGPSDLMIQSARNVTEQELEEAANYFSRQRLQPRVRIVETAQVPRSKVVGLVYAAIQGSGTVPLGQRLLEFAPDPTRHELRDDRLRYVAYVPTGSVERGRTISTAGVKDVSTACVSCHGTHLTGVGHIPALAGKSPTYLLRALYAFRSGARASSAAAPMRRISVTMSPAALIDIAAYAASLDP